MGRGVRLAAWVGVGKPSTTDVGFELKHSVSRQLELSLKLDCRTETRDAIVDIHTGGMVRLTIQTDDISTLRTFFLPSSDDCNGGSRSIAVGFCESHYEVKVNEEW